jgi:L-asparaginase II
LKIANPVIAEVIRGSIVESQHRGAFAVVAADGSCVASSGDIERPIFPRSAIKAFQCVPVIESGAADHFQFSDEEIALCCSSHNGEADHLRVAASMLKKIGAAETDYECGVHWPSLDKEKNELILSGQKPRAIHNNCSGKHAGMLAYAKHNGFDLQGYVEANHPVQKAIAQAIDFYCDVKTETVPRGIDGCSVPTWALPLESLARGCAKLLATDNLIGQRIVKSARAHPFMIAGTRSFDTLIMQAVPRLFIKFGAEGVFCGAIPHAGLGFALKCDDGAKRGAEVAAAQMLSKLDVWTVEEMTALKTFTHSTMHNWRKINVGSTQSNF